MSLIAGFSLFHFFMPHRIPTQINIVHRHSEIGRITAAEAINPALSMVDILL